MDHENWLELLREALGAPSYSEVAALVDALGGPRSLLRVEAPALCHLPGIGAQTARRIVAAIKLGSLLSRQQPLEEGARIGDAASAFAVLAPLMRGLDHEELHALLLDRRHRVIAHRVLSAGSERFTVVDPLQVFRLAIAVGAAAIIVAHNHPSGDPTPSPQDHEVTRRLGDAAAVLGVALLDHIVIAGDRFTSLAEQGTLEAWRPVAASWTA